MDLYDDIEADLGEGNLKKSDAWSNSAIHLLKDHLQTKKNAPNRTRNRYGNPYTPRNKQQSQTDDKTTTPVVSTLKSTSSFSGGEWDQEYDPLWPNDYEKIMKERRAMKDKSNNENRKRTHAMNTSLVARPLVDAYSDDEDDNDSKSSSMKKGANNRGAAIAPPPSLIESTVVAGKAGETKIPSNMGLGVAAKIMARMGYKDGHGLGKEEQGISSPLQVQKTSQRGGKIVIGDGEPESDVFTVPDEPTDTTTIPDTQTNSPISSENPVESITEIMKNPTKIVMLRNMVSRGDVDGDLEPEVKEECSKYGDVLKCVIYEMPLSVPEEESVRIFVEFKRVESAIKAIVDLNGRYFGGRTVRGGFYDVEKFKRLELNQ